jgi:hypothetical protein
MMWLRDLFFGNHQLVGRSVTARRAIADSPLAKEDGAANLGDRGEVMDFDGEFFYIDFGKGAILCSRSDFRLT